MSMLRFFLGGLITVLLAGGLGAQNRSDPEAIALLMRVAQNFAANSHMEVTGYTRELRAEAVQDVESTTPVYRVSGAEYRRLVLTFRRPDVWRIVSQSEQIMRGVAQPSRTFVFGGTVSGDSALLLLNASTKATSRISIPAGMFKQEVNERIGRAALEDAMFRLLFRGVSHAGSVDWAIFFGDAANLTIEGTEEVDGVKLTRIASSWPSNSITRLWIDAETLRLVRRLEAPSREGIKFFRSAEIKETIYRFDFTKGAADADFDLDAGWGLATPNIASIAGFSSSTELFAAITAGGTIKPEPPVTNVPKTPKTPKRPPAVGPSDPPGTGGVSATPSPASPSTSAAEPPSPAVVEIQALSAQQMEAIVLIEGDEGVGTGFVSRIRGVDFVVTNQHVIGGNEKIRVTTVRGATIKVGAMFGAVGRDIAILRIEGENTVPTLNLTEDPLKTAKLGDKVVVVGNRRGGGVATQVSGVVRGIGPDRIEVDAPFQPGNSGSPIVHVATGEVIGLATYSQKRKFDELDNADHAATSAKTQSEPQMEQRWFGYRVDGVEKWQSIDLSKWRAQAKRVEDFASDSESIYYAMNGRFKQAGSNVRVRLLIDRLDERLARMGGAQATTGQEVGEFFRGLRALCDSGVKELKTGEYYDFFLTSMYWETSITEQLRAREELARALDSGSENVSAFLEKLRR